VHGFERERLFATGGAGAARECGDAAELLGEEGDHDIRLAVGNDADDERQGTMLGTADGAVDGVSS